MKYVFLILFYFIPVVSGYTGIFSLLDEKYIDNISDLPFSAGSPEISWQQQGHIKAWVDIVGFKDIARIDGIDYIKGKPESLALVQYDASGSPPGIFDSLTKSMSVYQSGENTVASLHVILKWHTISCDKNGCWVSGRFKEEKDFMDSEISPLFYPSLQSGSANITEYNNTFNPKTAISLNLPGNISKVTYRYEKETLTHYLSQGHVEQTAKEVYFLNLSEMDIWTATGNTSLQQLNTLVIIPNSSRPDYSQLSIEFSNPYETRTIPKENYSYERITYNSGSTFSDPLLMFVSMLATFFILSIIVIRRTQHE